MRQIFKVQLPIVTTHPDTTALVYNKDRSVEADMALTPELEAFFEGELKSFWYGELVGTQFRFDEEAPWQDW